MAGSVFRSSREAATFFPPTDSGGESGGQLHRRRKLRVAGHAELEAEVDARHRAEIAGVEDDDVGAASCRRGDPGQDPAVVFVAGAWPWREGGGGHEGVGAGVPADRLALFEVD